MWIVLVTSDKCGYRVNGICADTGRECSKENCPAIPGWEMSKEAEDEG